LLISTIGNKCLFRIQYSYTRVGYQQYYIQDFNMHACDRFSAFKSPSAATKIAYVNETHRAKQLFDALDADLGLCLRRSIVTPTRGRGGDGEGWTMQAEMALVGLIV